MNHYETNHIKNIVLAGSSKSGKTTLAECMLYEGGVISRRGSVEDKNTISDWHELEHERQNSVYSTIMHTEWRGTKINIIDAPGLDDFSGELISALRVADTAVLTLHAQYGVEVGTEIAWRYLKKYNKPTILAINHLDNSKVDFNEVIETAKSRFGQGVAVVQYPLETGEGFNCIIDLLKMTMYKFPPEGGKPEKLPIPDSEKERADKLHNALVEAAAEHDEALMELYFEKGELDEDEMRRGLRAGMLHRDLFPVFCICAKHNMGSGRMMGFIGNVAPSAGEMGPEETDEGEEVKVGDSETTLFFFKTETEKHAGSISYFKVCSGQVKPGLEMINTHNRSKEKISQIFVADGKERHQVDVLEAGDIGATVKLKDTHRNQTLRPTDDGVRINPIEFPNSRIRTAIKPLSQGDEEKLAAALHKISESDPTIRVEYSKELKQTILHGQGALHLQIVKWQMEHIYGVKIEFLEPKIPYRETIQKPAEADYRHKKQSGGSGQFGEVWIKIFPYREDWQLPGDLKDRGRDEIDLEWGGKLLFINSIVGGVIDTRFMPAILKGVMEIMEEGPITGSYARDIVIAVYDGKMHAVDSNEISFKLAGRHAFKDAFLNASPQLMEPIYKLDVLVPDEYMGEVMTDLQSRRAIVEGFGNEGPYQHITAKVPLAEMNRYSTSLSSISQGRATFTIEFSEYAQVPHDIQKKLQADREAEPVS